MSGYSIVRGDDVEDAYAGSDVPGEFRPLTGALGSEQLAVTLIRVPPHSDFEQGTGHFHDEVEELYLVTRGTLTMRFGDDVREVPAGSVVRVAPRTPRSHRNEGDEPVELWAVSRRLGHATRRRSTTSGRRPPAPRSGGRRRAADARRRGARRGAGRPRRRQHVPARGRRAPAALAARARGRPRGGARPCAGAGDRGDLRERRAWPLGWRRSGTRGWCARRDRAATSSRGCGRQPGDRFLFKAPTRRFAGRRSPTCSTSSASRGSSWRAPRPRCARRRRRSPPASSGRRSRCSAMRARRSMPPTSASPSTTSSASPAAWSSPSRAGAGRPRRRAGPARRLCQG